LFENNIKKFHIFLYLVILIMIQFLSFKKKPNKEI